MVIVDDDTHIEGILADVTEIRFDTPVTNKCINTMHTVYVKSCADSVGRSWSITLEYTKCLR